MKKVVVLMVLFVSSLCVFAQNDTDIILEVGSEKVTKAEFMKMYYRNNPTNSANLNKQDLESYLDLFVNYKLKLLQAKEEGLDTTQAFCDEVQKYRKQIVEPYINDRTITDSLIQEAYDRELEFVRASHILITIPANASPEDTLIAYKKAMMVREKALKGENFAKLAAEYSDDPSAKNSEEKGQKIQGNGGDLGYFTSMLMIYPFESACYAMKKGEVSMPVRTNFGYHIINLTDRIAADFKTVDLKHVLISADKHSEEEAERLINEARANVELWGIDSVAKVYSEDAYSAQKGGWLIHQRCNTIPPEFVEAMQTMKEGELSMPVKSRYGWHFFRLTKRYPIPSLQEEKQAISQRISKDQRAYRSMESFMEKAKAEYGYKVNEKSLKELSTVVTDSVFSANWQIPSDFKGDKVLFTIGDSSYTQMNMLNELYVSQRKQTPEYIPTFLEKFLKAYSDNKAYEYADERLEEKHAELAESMQSFKEGILIFAITDKEVWNRSLEDSIGVQVYYDANKKNYIWKERADATMWTLGKSINLKKATKLIKKYTNKGLTNDEINDKLLKAFSITENPKKYVAYSWNRYEKGANRNIDKLVWDTDIAKDFSAKNVIVTDTVINTSKNVVLVLRQFDMPKQKTLDECKGIVTSQYQELLEQNWIMTLRNRYTYKINYEVFNSLK